MELETAAAFSLAGAMLGLAVLDWRNERRIASSRALKAAVTSAIVTALIVAAGAAMWAWLTLSPPDAGVTARAAAAVWLATGLDAWRTAA